MRVRIFARDLRGRSCRAIRYRLSIERLESRSLLTAFHVISSADDGSEGTLRWAILEANKDQDSDTIDFAIDSRTIPSIQLTSELPAITSPLVIDGTTHGVSAGIPGVEIDGSKLLAAGSNGITISAGDSTVRGLVINGFSGAGILLTDGGGNLVVGNYLGTDLSGRSPKPNGVGVSVVGSSNNSIGGITASDLNLISGNRLNGISIASGTPSTGNLIQGNLIGVDGTGLRSLPNGLNGIFLDNSSSNTIGGTLAGAGNVISGNLGGGIAINDDLGVSSRNLIQGNLIGVASDGLHAVGNLGDGIFLDGSVKTTIGGLAASASNVISANNRNGINLSDSSTSTLIIGNFIGTDGAGLLPIGNQRDGIYLAGAPWTTIGGRDDGSRNVISANFGNGINAQAGSDHLAIVGNSIGTDSSGLKQLGNQSNGIFLGSSQSLIGGSTVDAGNIIAFNGTGALGTGILLSGNAQQDSILSNSIFGNHRLGISLGNGPTPNDYHDLDAGPNGLQNYPVLSSAQADGVTTQIKGTLSSSPNSTYLIQFFSTPNVDPTGFGPGKVYLGSINVATDQDGNATFSTPGLDPSSGGYLTATATSADGSTSEFSQAVAITTVADLKVTMVASSDNPHVGDAVTYTVTVTNLSAVPANGVVLSDTLAGAAVVQSVLSSQGGPASVIGNYVTASLGTLAGGASATITILVKSQARDSATVVNSAKLSSQSLDPNLVNNTSTILSTFRASADLAITIEPDSASTLIQTDAGFTITVSNQGPSDAHGIVVALPLDPSFVFISSTLGLSPTTGADGSLQFAVGDLESGKSLNFKLVLQAASISGLVVAPRVSSNEDDLNAANNSVSLTEPVVAASDLSVSIQSSQDQAYRGRAFTYIVHVSNDGPCDASTVIVNLTLSDGLNFISSQSDSESPSSFTGNVFTAQIGTLKAGEGTTFSILVDPTTGSPAQVTAAASVSSTTPDLDPANDTANVSTTVKDSSDLSLTLDPPSATATSGVPFSYVFTVTNHGPDDDAEVIFTENLAMGLTLVSASATQGSRPVYSNGTLSLNLGTIPAGASVVITVTASATIAPSQGLSSTASVQGQNDDLDSTNNSVTSITYLAAVNLSNQLVMSQTQLKTGDVFTITDYVRNVGGVRATNGLLDLPLSPLVEVLHASSSSGTLALIGNRLHLSFDQLIEGASTTVTIQLRAIASGTMNPVSTLSTNERNVDPSGGVSSTACEIQDSAGTLSFASPSSTVLQTDGYASIPVLRSWGSAGMVTVGYRTLDGSAVAGRDYIPISGSLTFAPGQSSQMLRVPLVDIPHSWSDSMLSLILTDPTSGAVIGSLGTTNLIIRDTSPDTVPPVVINVSLVGVSKSISGISIAFSESLDPRTANLAGNYRLVDLGLDDRIGTTDDRQIAILAPSYDPSSHIVTITPQAPLLPNHYYGIQIVGTGPDAISDLAENPLDGTGSGQPGASFSILFARGNNLSYKDSQGNAVNLRLQGPGFIDQFRSPSGDGQSLILTGVVQRKSTLSGSVKKGRVGSGTTQLGTIDGLGTFGQVRVKLASPAFSLRQYPFQGSSPNQPLASPLAKHKVKHAAVKIPLRQGKLHHPR